MPVAVVRWIVPPVPAPPVPLTLRPPDDPVLLRTMPLAGPLAAVPAVMLRNSRLLALIVVWATLSAVPVVVVSVLTSPPVAAALHGFSSQTSMVPPLVAAGPGPVAANAALAPVVAVRPPRKLIVAPVLVVNEMPWPVSVTWPVKARLEPLSAVLMRTERPVPE